MNKKQLQQLADNGQWQERAVLLLQKRTNACIDVIRNFVHTYWQDLDSDEDNLYNFEIYESQFDDVYAN